MNSDWTMAKLSDLISIKHGFAFKGEFFCDSPTTHQLTTPGNFAIGGGFQKGKGKYYSGPIDDDYVLDVGDIIVTMTDLSKQADTLGFAAMVPYSGKTVWLHNQRVGLVQIKEASNVDRQYLLYLMRSPEYRQWVLSTASGSTVKHTSPSRICEYQFLLPSIGEQTQIGATLAAFDARIALLEETNVILEGVAQALFKSWFVDFDPVRARAEGREVEGISAEIAELFPDVFEESTSSSVPKGWFIRSVADVSSRIFSGGTPDTRNPEFWGGHLPWFSSGETRERVIIDCEKRITISGVENSSTKAAQPGDILIASAGQGHTRGQTSYCAIDTYINQSVVSIRANEKICSSVWLFHNLSRRYDEMRNLSDSHSSRGSLTTKLLGGMRVIVPDLPVIKAFTDIASPLMTAQINNAMLQATLSNLRDVLLPRLISGQLHPRDAEALLRDAA